MTNAKKAKQQRAAGTRKPAAGRARPRRSSSTGVWIGFAALVAVLVAVAVLTSGGSGEPSPTGAVSIARSSGPMLQAGDAVPDFSAPSLDGAGDVKWADFVGEPTVLAVWAPWCSHCQAELPRLSAAIEGHPAVQLVTITTAIGDNPGPSPQGYLDSKGLDFVVAVDDEDKTLMQGLGVTSFPTVYFVGSDGNVVRAEQGEIGMLPDGSVDESVLESMLVELEQS